MTRTLIKISVEIQRYIDYEDCGRIKITNNKTDGKYLELLSKNYTIFTNKSNVNIL